VAAAVLGVLISVFIAEACVRAGKWTPRVQIVRGRGLHSVGGVPVWEQSTDRHNRACVEQHPERTRIVFFGSSVTYGTDLTADEAFGKALEARLNERRPTPGFCVLNFAQPGFAFEQKYAIARAEVVRYKPALIMWEDWVEWPEYRLIGDAAYATADLRVRDDGFVGMWGVPDVINRVLFRHSRLYEYLVLAAGERMPRVPGPHGVVLFANNRLIEVPRLAQSVGAKLVMYLAPPLDQPFSETATALPEWHAILLDFAREHGIPAYPLQRELIDQDYLQLRLDPCCHFNAAGHRALVPIMERIVLGQLDGGSPGAASR
jgi:hypothetical protein